MRSVKTRLFGSSGVKDQLRQTASHNHEEKEGADPEQQKVQPHIRVGFSEEDGQSVLIHVEGDPDTSQKRP